MTITTDNTCDAIIEAIREIRSPKARTASEQRQVEYEKFSAIVRHAVRHIVAIELEDERLKRMRGEAL